MKIGKKRGFVTPQALFQPNLPLAIRFVTIYRKRMIVVDLSTQDWMKMIVVDLSTPMLKENDSCGFEYSDVERE